MPSAGPAHTPAHLVLKRVIGDILQVDEHIEIRAKHTRLQGLHRHLQQPRGRALVGTGGQQGLALPIPQPRGTAWGPHASFVKTAN